MRTSGRRRRPRKQAERPASDSARVVARYVRQRVRDARARGRRRLTARHGRGVRAFAMRALSGGGRVQRGAAGAAQPAAARAAAGPLFRVPATGAPVRRGGARAAAALRASGGSRAGGALRATASSAAAPSATGVLLAGVPSAAAGAAQVLRTSLPRGHRGLAAADALRGVRWGRGGAPAGLHAAAATTAWSSAALRAPGAALLRASTQATTAST